MRIGAEKHRWEDKQATTIGMVIYFLLCNLEIIMTQADRLIVDRKGKLKSSILLKVSSMQNPQKHRKLNRRNLHHLSARRMWIIYWNAPLTISVYRYFCWVCILCWCLKTQEHSRYTHLLCAYDITVWVMKYLTLVYLTGHCRWSQGNV